MTQAYTNRFTEVHELLGADADVYPIGVYPTAGFTSMANHQRAFVALHVGDMAQGATVDDAAVAFHEDGWGALVSVSRGVIYAWEREQYKHLGEVNWEEAIEAATLETKAALAEALARRAAAV